MIYVLLNSEVPLAKSTAKNSLKIERGNYPGQISAQKLECP